MLPAFTMEQPQIIHFGPGCRADIPALAAELGRRVLLFTGSSWFEGSGFKAELAELLADFVVEHLRCPRGEPETGSLAELLAAARRFAPELILAVGGGSVLDSAKAVSGLLRAGDEVEDYLEGVGRGLKIEAAGVPWIAVPTTAGTGAEVTKNAVLKARSAEAKKSLRSSFLLASRVLVDPELSRDCPFGLTGVAGMDALTQLVESFVSRKARPIPRALALDAFPVMLAALYRMAREPRDLEARTGAAYGAMVSGITLANSGLGAAHGFASGLGGVYDIPHGLLCALFIRPVLRANVELIRSDCELLRRAARERPGPPAGNGDRSGGLAAEDSGKGDAVQWLIECFDELFDLYGLPSGLKGLGVEADRVPELARRSSGSSMSGNPKELSQEERERIIRSLL